MRKLALLTLLAFLLGSGLDAAQKRQPKPQTQNRPYKAKMRKAQKYKPKKYKAPKQNKKPQRAKRGVKSRRV
ncbi:MAG: hypothetical protein HYR60_04240 [Acidobacteria bacterium]|nr:hypothetical protein [Acidobacteriota bacterium]MBI3472172.1 hypothetical protein [Candidatus Solibacter usitatus]